MSKKKAISAKLRASVLARDNHICRACGFGGSANFAFALDCDHIIAESNGGETIAENLQCLCKGCNVSKSGNDWQFAIRVASTPEEIWSHNQRVMAVAFIADTAKRLRKLK